MHANNLGEISGAQSAETKNGTMMVLMMRVTGFSIEIRSVQ